MLGYSISELVDLHTQGFNSFFSRNISVWKHSPVLLLSVDESL